MDENWKDNYWTEHEYIYIAYARDFCKNVANDCYTMHLLKCQ